MIELPFLNRRKMLLGLAAASAAAVPVIALAADQAASLPTPENVELIRLGDKLPRAVKAYYASVRRMHRIVDRWQPEWPTAPKEAVADWRDRKSWETNLEGRPMLPDGSQYEFDFEAERAGTPKPRTLIASADLERHIRRLDRDRVRRRPKHPLTADQIAELQNEISALSERLAIVRSYEAEKDRVLKASGYPEARAAYLAKRAALIAMIGAVMAEPAVTIEGVIVKAQALSVLSDGHLRAMSFIEQLDQGWITGFADQVLEIAGRQAA
jgi:hypothetical protein